MASIRQYQRKNDLAVIPEAGQFLKLLVVEGDTFLLDSFNSTVNSWPLPVDVTAMSSALEALRDIHTLQPDVLITDLKMPGMDGFELLRTLRANASFSSMVLVSMTGLSPAEVTERGGLPAHTVTVQKPVDMLWFRGFLAAMVAFRQF